MSGANTWDGLIVEFRNGEMKMVNYQLIPVNLKKKVTWEDGKSERVLYTPEIAENQQMISLLSPFQNKGKAQLEVKMAKPIGASGRRSSRSAFCTDQYGAVDSGSPNGSHWCRLCGDERRREFVILSKQAISAIKTC